MHSPTFAELLKERRIRAGLSQEALAELAAMSVQAISALERGARSRPYKDTVLRLASALGLSDDERAEFEIAAQGKPRVRGLASLASVHNGVAELRPLIGRDDEVRDLCDALVSGERLISIVGPGGVGKTALARAVSTQLHCRRCDGHKFIELEHVVAPEHLPAAIAAALNVSTVPDAMTAVMESLEPRRMLLVLDNFERVLAAAPRIVDLLLRCPDLSVLITSREPLHVRGEMLFQLDPLSAADGQALFVQTAQRVDRTFSVTEQNQTALAEVLDCLEGLPLAIELAAARLGKISLSELRDRMRAPLTVLTNGYRDGAQRHSTMEAAIAWSYDALSEEERRAFLRVASLPAGCHAEAVLAACTDSGCDGAETEGILEALADKNLLKRAFSSEGEPRLEMLGVIRDFGSRVVADPQIAQLARDRHTCWYAAYAAEAVAHLGGSGQRTWLRRLRENMTNLRCAFSWTVEKRDVRTALLLASDLFEYYYRAGAYGEARTRLETALGLAQACGPSFPEESRAALVACGRVAAAEGDFDAARRCFDEAQAQPEIDSGEMLLREGKAREALAHFEPALNRARAVGDVWSECLIAANIARCRLELGELPHAIELLARSLQTARETGHPLGIQRALQGIAEVRLAQGDLCECAGTLKESLLLAHAMGARPLTAQMLLTAAHLCLNANRPKQAVELCGAAVSACKVMRMPLGRTQELERTQIVAAATALLSRETCEAIWNEGNGLQMEDAVRIADAVLKDVSESLACSQCVSNCRSVSAGLGSPAISFSHGNSRFFESIGSLT